MRLIDADALYIWVKTECNPYGKPTLDFESGKKVLSMIDRMPTIESEQHWIPVEERLPKAYEDCLWTTTDGRVVFYYCDGMFSKYTAWMPLPKPYREKNCQQEEMTFKLNHPLTEEQWDAIAYVDMEHTPMIEFHTKNGKIVKYRKVEEE